MSEDEIKRRLDLIETLKAIMWERIRYREKVIKEKLNQGAANE